jgi:hypothetical protein
MGQYWTDVNVVDSATGQTIAASTSKSVIDGAPLGGAGSDGAAWTLYTRRLPETILRGSWGSIGYQMGQKGILSSSSVNITAADMTFYRQRFPYYASLVDGARQYYGLTPLPLTSGGGVSAAAYNPDVPLSNPEGACMGFLIPGGPQGAMCGYSKERSSTSISGMGYAKIVPDAGYQYHMYTLNSTTFGYGVNSEGLATAGATINTDSNTTNYGNTFTSNYKAGGGRVAPLGMHMLLAMCKTVDEAISFIDNNYAPFEFNDNFFVTDKNGDAVILESIGVFHQLLRYDHSSQVWASGNYSHKNAQGYFDIGSNWGYAANTMLKETYLTKKFAELNWQVSLEDALRIMASQAEPGNINQHLPDNPGVLYSTASILAVSNTGDLWISNGPPNEVETIRYQLDIPEPASLLLLGLAAVMCLRRR